MHNINVTESELSIHRARFAQIIMQYTHVGSTKIDYISRYSANELIQNEKIWKSSIVPVFDGILSWPGFAAHLKWMI